METATKKDRTVVVSSLLGTLITYAMVGLGVYGMNTYGVILFIVTPLVAATVSSFYYTRRHPNNGGEAIGVSFLTMLLSMVGMLLLGLEGLLCIVMAAVPAAFLFLIGALIGHAVASRSGARGSHLAIAVICLPLLAGAEAKTVAPALNEVVTTIEIDAPPEAVWPHVIAYAELPAPPEWFFRAGIGYPEKVWMAGTGVGATRYCGFSTGTYVEPITHWEPPHRLAFDVTNTPPAMKELSIYEHVHAPHLAQTPRNRRGEFRLTRLPGNRTRLAGSSWYDIEMYPQFYWRLWADAAAQAVHERVFAHIKRQAEKKQVAGRRS